MVWHFGSGEQLDTNRKERNEKENRREMRGSNSNPQARRLGDAAPLGRGFIKRNAYDRRWHEISMHFPKREEKRKKGVEMCSESGFWKFHLEKFHYWKICLCFGVAGRVRGLSESRELHQNGGGKRQRSLTCQKESNISYHLASSWEMPIVPIPMISHLLSLLFPTSFQQQPNFPQLFFNLFSLLQNIPVQNT